MAFNNIRKVLAASVLEEWEMLCSSDNEETIEKIRKRGRCTYKATAYVPLCLEPATVEFRSKKNGDTWPACPQHEMYWENDCHKRRDESWIKTRLGVPAAPKVCACPIRDLMMGGCKCGGK